MAYFANIREFTIRKNLDDDAASSWSRRLLNASYKMNLRNLEHTRLLFIFYLSETLSDIYRQYSGKKVIL